MMETPEALATTELPLPRVGRGKVRDIYDAGDQRLLIVATDRISAFDVVLSRPIPSKGVVLTQLTAWWLARLGDITQDHLISADPGEILDALPALEDSYEEWAGRAMLVRRTEVVPIECVVRGYLSGSAWKEYRQSGTLAGEPFPPALVESARLDAPIFSPATKAVAGHDENITFGQMGRLVGDSLAAELRRRSLAIYQRGRDLAEAAGIIVADTKFEFGRLPDGRVLLIDEVLTPDSSRFWPKESYQVGRAQPSLDKQPVRDFLESLVGAGRWNREPPPPDLPDQVVEETSRRYRNVFRRITGFALEEFPTHDPGAVPLPGEG